MKSYEKHVKSCHLTCHRDFVHIEGSGESQEEPGKAHGEAPRGEGQVGVMAAKKAQKCGTDKSK